MRFNNLGVETTPFNSSLAFLERIERRWEDCDQAKIAGNIITYFRTLETIYRNTHPFFKEDECEESEDKIKQIEKLLEENHGNSSLGRRFEQDNIWLGENSCDELRMILVKLLFKYKITYYKIEHKTWEDELKEDFE